jgi:CBS domain-containing protein
MATYSNSVKRFSTGPLHGTALALYFVLLPYVVITKWTLTHHEANGTLIRVLLVALGIFWLAFLFQVGHNIVRLRKGFGPGAGGTAWLAGLVVAILPFLIPASASASPLNLQGPAAFSSNATDSPWLLTPDFAPAASTRAPEPRDHGSSTPLTLMGGVPVALMAKRRHDLLRQQHFDQGDTDVDEVIELLRSYNPALMAELRFLFGVERSGVIRLATDREPGEQSLETDELVACVLGHDEEGLVISFAREGGDLAIEASWNSDDVLASVVAMHDGRLVFAVTESELLRALATRVLHRTMVIYLGVASDLDDELRACCVTLSPISRSQPLARFDFAQPVTMSSPTRAVASADIRVELLRANPEVVGLVEPFTPTLRRRCVEMVAYLALHRGEPVTGDRLRSRVLSHADVEASNRTLANTASAVRRSMGTNTKGPRLHPVTSSGLYATHGVTSDVEIFHTLVTRARALSIEQASPLVREALLLVKGEPLASALRGFEWFLAEGHNASLQRDGEWAALVLHHDAMSHENYELAFWSLQQGLLVDPYSDVLLDALARVPRLRQFGGDGPGRTKHETVGTSGAVAVGWSFNGFGNQVSQ